ncbi:MAG: hypothetical protein ACK4TD_00450 [Ectopseudomonas guguanensis]|uniref:hypothetical protein n=1 Tax=Ectopseudomonas guguanensis TaxID=1198456 RepID=UPI00391A209B
MSTATVFDQGPQRTLEEAVDLDCREYRGGHTAVCAILGEAYGPFQKRLSTAYPDHHLRGGDLARVVQLVRGPAVLEWFEQVYGVTSFAVQPVEATRDAMLGMGRYLTKHAAYVSAVAEAAEDGVWTDAEVAALDEHTWAVIRKMLGILEGAKQAAKHGQEVRHG